MYGFLILPAYFTLILQKGSIDWDVIIATYIQYTLSGSNTDGWFTVDDSNSFFSPYKILPVAQEKKCLGISSYFIMELYVVCTH